MSGSADDTRVQHKPAPCQHEHLVCVRCEQALERRRLESESYLIRLRERNPDLYARMKAALPNFPWAKVETIPMPDDERPAE